jgi:hypothetical protein
MLVPLPAAEPVMPALVVAVQAKVAPATLLVKAIPVFCPEQIVWADGVAITFGAGFTVAITVTGVPTQLLGAGPVGVMV